MGTAQQLKESQEPFVREFLQAAYCLKDWQGGLWRITADILRKLAAGLFFIAWLGVDRGQHIFYRH